MVKSVVYILNENSRLLLGKGDESRMTDSGGTVKGEKYKVRDTCSGQLGGHTEVTVLLSWGESCKCVLQISPWEVNVSVVFVFLQTRWSWSLGRLGSMKCSPGLGITLLYLLIVHLWRKEGRKLYIFQWCMQWAWKVLLFLLSALLFTIAVFQMPKSSLTVLEVSMEDQRR